MAINPDPFHLVQVAQSVEPKTHDQFLESLSVETPSGASNRGILFVTEDIEYYKELGALVAARCYEQGRKFSFRYSDFTVFIEGEHLIRLYDLLNRGRLSVVREGLFKLRNITLLIKKVEVLEEKKGGTTPEITPKDKTTGNRHEAKS